jgi:hypothetical protein
LNLRPPAPQAGIITKLDDGPSWLRLPVKLLNRGIHSTLLIVCSICHKLSANGKDHLDCQELRKIELEAKDFKEKIPEKLELSRNETELSTEIKAILEHMTKQKDTKKSL